MGTIFITVVLVVTSLLALYWVFYGQRKHNEMMNPKRKTELKAILFDMDGVILDSFQRQFTVFNELRKKHGFKILKKKDVRTGWWGNSLEVNAELFFKGVDFTKLRKEYNATVLKHMDKGKLMEDAKEVLKKIKAKKIKTGLVTNTTSKRTQAELKFFKVRNLFDVVVTADDVEKPKPYPDPVLKACKMLKVEADEVIYVGDTKNDYKAGKSAGAFVVGFNTKGDLIISRLKDILELI